MVLECVVMVFPDHTCLLLGEAIKCEAGILLLLSNQFNKFNDTGA